MDMSDINLTWNAIIPVILYIIGFFLIYFYIDKRKELLRFDESNIDIYKRTRDNIKESHHFNSIEEIIKEFYISSLKHFSFNSSLDNASKKDVKSVVFTDTINLLEQYIRNKENFDLIFRKASFQHELEKLNEGTDEILELDDSWCKIVKFGKFANYSICLLLIAIFLSAIIYLSDEIVIWLIWGGSFIVILILYSVFHHNFSNNKKKFNKKKQKYYVNR